MEKDITVIPKGSYCYTYEGDDFKICPYWDTIEGAPKQYNGYCHYLEKGDIDLEQKMEFLNTKTNETVMGVDLPFPCSLLWDQCKECGINNEDNEF